MHNTHEASQQSPLSVEEESRSPVVKLKKRFDSNIGTSLEASGETSNDEVQHIPMRFRGEDDPKLYCTIQTTRRSKE